MKYLKLSLITERSGIVYEKDVEAQNVAGAFVRRLVSDLVHDGTVQQGEYYSATLIPHYDDNLQQRPVLSIEPDDSKCARRWIELRYDEPVQPDRMVRYFTVEIFVHGRRLLYREDFSTRTASRDYVQYGITQALLGLGVLRVGETYLACFHARDDGKAQFDQERMPALERQASTLIELVGEQQKSPSFPFRDPITYGQVERVGQEGPDDISIYLRRQTLERLVHEGKLSVDVERGGMLVGMIYQKPTGGRYIVEISDLVISEHTVSSEVELRYTFESWRVSNAVIKEQFPGKRVVGWYHTHLVDMPTRSASETSGQTKLFFSRDDLFLHRQFFPDDWYVAMVLDPQGQSIFFQWKKGEIVECPTYCIYDDVGIAG